MPGAGTAARRRHRVVIAGGGFGGLYTARALAKASVDVTLVDQRNFHLFQPLLYQVATGGLSPGDIASPLRSILKRQRNARVLLGQATGVDVERRRLLLNDGELEYDTLILCTGVRHAYFGNDQWEPLAPGLKTVEDALEIRRRLLLAFEAAEREPDPEVRRQWLTFVIVGAGPTGVELAGTLGEIAHFTLPGEFRRIDPKDARILLLEGSDRVLETFPLDLSRKACEALDRLGVTVMTGHKMIDMGPESVTIKAGEQIETVGTRTVLWAAGVRASPLGKSLAEATGSEVDRAGRVKVQPDLTVCDHPEIFVIGDLAFLLQDGKPLPGIAPVAMQQGRYVAQSIAARLEGRALPPFRYHHKGSLAAIGRPTAVADLGRIHLSGFIGWLFWLFVHLFFIIEFENRVLIMIQWAWNYFTRNRRARLITGYEELPALLKEHANRSETAGTRS